MKVTIFLGFFSLSVMLIAVLSEAPLEPTKELTEDKKKYLNRFMTMLKTYFSNIKAEYLKIQELEKKAENDRNKYEGKLNLKPMVTKRSDDDRKSIHPPSPFIMVRKIDSMSIELGMFKVNVEDLHTLVKEAENRLNQIRDKTTRTMAAYKITAIKALAEKNGEGHVFEYLKEYHEKREESYLQILEHYGEINKYFYYTIIPLTIINEHAFIYKNFSEEMNKVKNWAKNWNSVKSAVINLTEENFSYKLYENAKLTENLLTLPINKEKVAKP